MGDDSSETTMGELTERLHVNVPLTDAYVLRGPKLTFIINTNPTTPEERVLDDLDDFEK